MAERRRPPVLSGLAVVVAVLVSACGSAAAETTQALHPRVLKPSAVPGLTGSVHTVTLQQLTHDAPVGDLAHDLSTWGFQSGTQADYRGDGGRFSVVTSRTLVFTKPAGARAYVAMVESHASAFEGGAALSAPITSAGRSGVLLTAGSCGCATEVPQLLAVASAGRRVTWLEVTGRTATAAAVMALLEKAP